MHISKAYFFSAIITILFSSCCIQGKIDEAKRTVANSKDTLGVENSRINFAKATTGQKFADRKIDSIIFLLVNQRLSALQLNMDPTIQRIKTIETYLSNINEFRKKYKSVIAPLLDSLKNSTAQYRLKNVAKYDMIDEGLSIADYKLFDLAAFFGPGKYSIPPDKRELAGASFFPIVDSIIQFSNKYKSLSRTGTLIILGFADGTGFGEGPLADMLAEKIGKANPSKEEMNQKLSELRAEELISLLSSEFLKKAPIIENKDELKVNYVRVGKGENLPLPTIKDYKVEDDRRRIVLCYWSVLPD